MIASWSALLLVLVPLVVQEELCYFGLVLYLIPVPLKDVLACYLDRVVAIPPCGDDLSGSSWKWNLRDQVELVVIHCGCDLGKAQLGDGVDGLVPGVIG